MQPLQALPSPAGSTASARRFGGTERESRANSIVGLRMSSQRGVTVLYSYGSVIIQVRSTTVQQLFVRNHAEKKKEYGLPETQGGGECHEYEYYYNTTYTGGITRL